MKTKWFIFFLLLAWAFPVFGEIEKFAVPGEKSMAFYWWPKLSVPRGWVPVREASLENKINILVLEGKTFSDSETVIYSRALYKPREKIRSLEELIRHDVDDFKENVPGVEIRKEAPIVNTNGTALACNSFFPKSEGNWEMVAYGEEGDFFVIFTLSSRSKKDFDAALPAFTGMVKDYNFKSGTDAAPVK